MMDRDMPERVPSRVRVHRLVCGDGPWRSTEVNPGEYACKCNRYGAVSVQATDGTMLGLKPDEFEPIDWVENAK